ncbi:hypothetical protein JOH51_004706 [Rhizobium leguminosarum]|nr:hypothetical protein [Rhizobium leguminosarum]
MRWGNEGMLQAHGTHAEPGGQAGLFAISFLS